MHRKCHTWCHSGHSYLTAGPLSFTWVGLFCGLFQLFPVHQTRGGVAGEGTQSYTATVIHAAKVGWIRAVCFSRREPVFWSEQVKEISKIPPLGVIVFGLLWPEFVMDWTAHIVRWNLGYGIDNFNPPQWLCGCGILLLGMRLRFWFLAAFWYCIPLGAECKEKHLCTLYLGA